MLNSLRSKIRSKEFLVSKSCIVISPVYIIRRALFKAIESNSKSVIGNVLDFGCGSKPYVSLFKNIQSYVGVDLQTSGHDHSGSLIDVFYDGKSLPFVSDYFDTVVSFEVFEHVPNLDSVLEEIKRVLKPNGILFLSTPFCWGEHEQPFDFARYTSFGMETILERNNFKIVKIHKMNTSFLAISQLLISYIANFVLPRGRIGFFCQLLVVFPLNVVAVSLNKILPKSDESFSGLVVLAQKI